MTLKKYFTISLPIYFAVTFYCAFQLIQLYKQQSELLKTILHNVFTYDTKTFQSMYDRYNHYHMEGNAYRTVIFITTVLLFLGILIRKKKKI